MLGIGLSILRSRGVAAPAAAQYDLYVAPDGDDMNDGSAGAPFATVTKLAQAMSASDSDTTTTAFIAAGDYLDDQFAPAVGGKTDVTMELTFEEGCTLQSGATIEGGMGAGNTGINGSAGARVFVYGNGLTVSGFMASSGNGIGSGSGGYIVCHDVNATNCDDGFSLHGDAYGELHRGTISNCAKSCVAHVNTSSSKHYDCTFIGDYSGSMVGLVLTQGPNRHEFHRCTAAPSGNNIGIGCTNGAGVDVLFDECVLGSLTARVAFTTNQAAGLDVTNSFVNASFDASHDMSFDECYGFLSLRHRNGGGAGGGITMTNCVWGGGSSGATDALIYANYDPGSGSPINITDCVVVGYGTALGASFSAALAEQFIDAGAGITHTLFHANGTDIDADLIADDGYAAAFMNNVTGSDPLLGAMNTTAKADWGYGEGSPCIGAGSGGADIGFAAAA